MQALAPVPARRTASMELLRDQLGAWLERAEAAGWGEEALPGFRLEDRERPTVTRAGRSAASDEGPDDRLGPYLDALQSGGVGSRRAAAEGLRRSARPGDEAYLLEALAHCPESARFALVAALGDIGGADSLPALMGLLEDPFARVEAAEAASLVALREGREATALAALREPGLGVSWRWASRARLGDESWAKALREEWAALSATLRLQALGAARQLPDGLKADLKVALAAEAQRAGGHLLQAWDSL